jgi:type IV pilus assembly protein PilC
MIWVVPAFKEVFTSFGADLPAPTLFVMAISDFFVKYWYMIFGGLFGPSIFLPDLATLLTNAAHHGQTTVASPYFRRRDQKSNDCSLDRTLATMFAAGVPWLSRWIPSAALPVMLCILTLR